MPRSGEELTAVEAEVILPDHSKAPPLEINLMTSPEDEERIMRGETVVVKAKVRLGRTM